ncbi:uncharacterized protein K452DRAFT_251551 [Aplosporella prunicola CBS 121167]|uniref:Tyrosine--tRNA ligase n=1 Tax=Aplosporella prunicola CBS 121167 TaxID=1176127 RepID=A0A6A6B9S3_9PEZI|nr:uncharacterized protein K452DRAFT_251551 [Aplosporella prunicola CBS 121167]KAF2140820.1 hypothetical protein K452DRAFT_251551 [Aplosporella prunicola CBS 121167]
MAPLTLLRNALRPGQYALRQCPLRRVLPRTVRRSITQGTIRKRIEAEWEWKEQAKQIRKGEKQSFLSFLEERGYIKQIAGGRDILDRAMTDKRLGAYVGIDPTAPSMHVGHILPFMVIFWMYLHGFHAITLLGGATAKVGDPTDRLQARDLGNSATRKANMAAMHFQIKKIWASVEVQGRKHGFQRQWSWRRALVNNNVWHQKLTVIEFLKVLASGIPLGPLLSRDTVKNRQKKGNGMSFAEFTYPLLQAWDWWHMFSHNRITIQVGGSDQFGNIVAGIDAINYVRRTVLEPLVQEQVLPPTPDKEYMWAPYGITVPLLTTPSGEKFGKSAGNAIWLDKEMTSSYDLYGFWMKTPDSEVERYLKLFTFLPLSTIKSTVQEHMKDPSQRVAQHLLAEEFVELVHGQQSAREAAAQHKAFFLGRATKNNDATAGNVPIAWDNAPSTRVKLPESLVYGQTWSSILWSAGLVASKAEANRLIQAQGAYVGSRPGQVGGMGDEVKFTPIKAPHQGDAVQYIFDEKHLLLRIGKWKIKFVEIISDEEFREKGLEVPGWQTKAEGAKAGGAKNQ